jgi:uncharacterized protein YceH (UPF0502 family)
MTPLDSQQALSDALAPLLSNGRVRRLDPLPGTRAERYVQTLAPAAHALETRAASPLAQAVAAPPPQPAREEQTALEKRVADLEEQSARLRRQLDHLAWSLGKKLEG